MKHKALKIFLLGLLIHPPLINIVGFIDPFFTQFVLKDIEKSRFLLHAVQPYVLFVSVIFVLAFYHLQKIDDRLWLKIICLVASLIYIVSSVHGFMPRGDNMRVLVKAIYYLMQYILLLSALLILIKEAKRELN